MRQVSQNISPGFFIRAYLILFSTEFLWALANPSFVQLFFDEHSPFFGLAAGQNYRGVSYGLFMMLAQLAGIFANISWGFLSDRWGRKAIILMSFFGVFIAGISTLYSAQYHALLFFITGYVIGRLLYGMFPVIIATVNEAAYHDKRKLLWIGMMQFFTGFAFVAGPYLGTLMMTRFSAGFIAPYYALAIIPPILITICLAFLRFQPGSHRKINFMTALSQSLTLLKQKKITILTLLLLLDQFAWGTFFQFVQPIAKLSLGFSTHEIGLLVSFIGISLMISAMIILPILQKFIAHRHLFILAILLMLGGSLLLILIASDHSSKWMVMLYILTFLVACGDMMIFSLITVGFSNSVPITHQGMIAGVLYTLASGFGWGFAGLIGGILMTLSLSSVMAIASVSLIVLLVFYLKIGKAVFA
ncbi:MAG: MFS transporter [Francisellaceae bacterium]